MRMYIPSLLATRLGGSGASFTSRARSAARASSRCWRFSRIASQRAFFSLRTRCMYSFSSEDGLLSPGMP